MTMDVLERIEKGELSFDIFNTKTFQPSVKSEIELLKLAKLGQQMQWVSVADRLPDEGQSVDIWVAKGYGHPGRSADVIYREDDGERWFEIGDMTFDLEEVSHWMPLPPSPKEED